jgi:inorganic triphosphatase YgiF
VVRAEAPVALEGVHTNVEHEYRFIPVANLPRAVVTEPRWHDYDVRPLPAERQRNTYLDTPTQALARQGISFRQRVRGDQAELTVKLPRDLDLAAEGLFARVEHTQPIALEASLAGHPLLALVERLAPNEPIEPWFDFFTDRRGVELERGNARIHLTWDRLTLPDDPDFSDEEIEAELVDGPVEELHALARLLHDRYGLRQGSAGKRTRVGRYLAQRGRIAFPGVAPEGRADIGI